MSAPEVRKAAAGGQAAFLKPSNDHAKSTARRVVRQRIKRTVVALALWGFLPAGFASWLLLRLALVSE
jgi:hypothetical protein